LPAPFEPGTFGYPLGSDRQGRDLWVTVMYGAQATFTLAFVVLAARLAIGVTLGAVAGWFAGRWIDRLVSALVDAFAAFPTLLFAVLWIFAFDIRSGLQAFAAALTITGWWGFGGATLAQGRFESFRARWIALVPAAAFASGVLAFNLAGHGLRMFFERAPVALGKLLGWRAAAVLIGVLLVLRLASPLVGPAAGL